jgi:hypothetical protein
MRLRAEDELRSLTRPGMTRKDAPAVQRKLEDWLYNTFSNAKDYSLSVGLSFTNKWTVSITERNL